MPRPPLELETWGKIQRIQHNKKCAALVYYRAADGRRRKLLRTGRTHAEAERQLTLALRESLTPTHEDITRDSKLSHLAEQWLEEVRREDKAIATVGRYTSTIRTHVTPIGDLRIRESTVPRLQRVVNHVSDQSGPAAARMVIVVLSGMFSLAARHGAIPDNPVRYVKGPPRKRIVVRAPAVEQIQRLRELLAAHDQRPAVKSLAIRDLLDVCDVMNATGARIGEVLALRWADVDFEAGRVDIHATLARIPGGGLIIQEHPKTDKSNRRLKLPPFAISLLTRRRVDAYCELVFPSANGTPRWPENIRIQWRAALAGTDLSWMTPTSCRKAVATLIAARVDIEAAAGQLGHASTRVTDKHYVPANVDRPDHSDVLGELGT